MRTADGTARLAHAREKGAKATYAMASVLHNRRIHLAVRRIVLQACVRPVVEYASTVWHGTQADMKRLEQVQYRVLKRMSGGHSRKRSSSSVEHGVWVQNI
jgi:hypothetical protein